MVHSSPIQHNAVARRTATANCNSKPASSLVVSLSLVSAKTNSQGLSPPPPLSQVKVEKKEKKF